MADEHTAEQLVQALDAVTSMLSKLVKSKATLEAKGSIRPGSAQQTLIDRRIAALRLSQTLIRREMDSIGGAWSNVLSP